MTQPSSAAGGFVAGTKVHVGRSPSRPTEYYRPIEQLTIGDLVLSMPENGIGKTMAKRVVNTVVFEQTPTWYVSFYDINDEVSWDDKAVDELPACSYFGVAANHPFLVVGQCVGGKGQYAVGDFRRGTPDNYVTYPQPMWKRADQLVFNDVLHSAALDKLYAVAISKPMYQYDPEQPQLAWVHGHDQEEIGLGYLGDERSGMLFDLSQIDDFSGKFELLELAVDHPNWDMDGVGIDEPDHNFVPYCTTVYNIEVEDYHTYLACISGIAVHQGSLSKCVIKRRTT